MFIRNHAFRASPAGSTPKTRAGDHASHPQPGPGPGRGGKNAAAVLTARDDLVRENPAGYHRIHGELTKLGVTVAQSTVWEILRTAGGLRADR